MEDSTEMEADKSERVHAEVSKILNGSVSHNKREAIKFENGNSSHDAFAQRSIGEIGRTKAVC